MNHVKLFIWNNFIVRFFKDWLDEYAEETNAEVYSPEPIYMEMRYDLD